MLLKKNEKEISTSTNLFENIPLKNFPIIDSTNFDNFEKIGIPDNGIIKQLKLKTKKVLLKFIIKLINIFNSLKIYL